jgi:large subunit ribosomal protein L17
VETTITKAKAARPHVEKLTTLGKKGDLYSRRLAISYLQTREAASRLFETVAPRYGDRAGGYFRSSAPVSRKAIGPKRPSWNS